MAGWKILEGVKGAALFHNEKDGIERRRSLHRDWSKPGEIIMMPHQPTTLVSIGMNPSIATGEIDDPTIRKEYTWARSYACYQRYTKFNVCDMITSHPLDMLECSNPSSKGNHKFILDSLKNMQSDIVLSWGILPKGLEYLAEDLLSALRKAGHTLYCWRINKNGSPGHPRFINLPDLKIQRYF
jgi:hypothetical protein